MITQQMKKMNRVASSSRSCGSAESTFLINFMSLLGAAIIKKSGDVLLSKQFAEFTKSRISLLLNNLTKLISDDSQSTYVESGPVRYLYQSVGSFYIVLLSLKMGNVFEDIETLKILVDSVISTCSPLNESSVNKSKFTLLSTFDEIVSMGFRENYTISQLKTVVEMDSLEEKIKIAQETEIIKEHTRKRKTLMKALNRQKRKEKIAFPSAMMTVSSQSFVVENTQPSPSISYQTQAKSSQYSTDYSKSTPISSKSLKLNQGGIGSKTQEILGLNSQMDIQDAELLGGHTETKRSTNVEMQVVEKVSCTISSDGQIIKPCAVEGELIVKISDPLLESFQIKLDSLTDQMSNSFSLMPRAQFEKATFFEKSVLQLKAGNKFPIDRDLPLLRWKSQKEGSNRLNLEPPVKVTCWVDELDKTSEVFIECTVSFADLTQFRDIKVKIPIENLKIQPKTTKVSMGTTRLDSESSCYIWSIPFVEPEEGSRKNITMNLEFVVASSSASSFSPISIDFNCPGTISNLRVDQIVSECDPSSDDFEEAPQIIPFKAHYRLISENYFVE